MALPIDIHALLKGSVIETERIEFKTGWNPEVIVRSICAFANDLNNVGGGYIIVGVEEKNGVAVLPPIGLEASKLDEIQKELLRVCHFIQPDYFPVVHPEKIGDRYILIIWCPPGQYRPYKAPKTLGKKDQINKPYYVRRMSSTVEAKDTDLQRLMDFAGRTPFDNQINYHASIDDLDQVHISNFLHTIKSDLRAEQPNLSTSELCRQMRIANGSSESLHPLNIGLLMFANKPHEFFRGARIEMVHYQDDIGDKFQETYFEGPVWMQLKDVLRHIQTHVIKEQIIKIDGQAEAKRFYNYPFESLEEAISNAVFHKGYDRQNPIEINIRHHRIEVVNFPGPLPPVNQTMLNGDLIIAKDCRNSRLGDFLKELDLTEGRGTGIPKIRRFMQKNGSLEPQFITDDDNNYFVTILPIHPDFIGENPTTEQEPTNSPIKSATKSPTKSSVKVELSEPLKKLLFALEQTTLSAAELLQALELKHRPSLRNNYIAPALEQELIEYTIPETPKSRLQKYRITQHGQAVINQLKDDK